MLDLAADLCEDRTKKMTSPQSELVELAVRQV